MMPEFQELKDQGETLDPQAIRVLLDRLGQMVQWELLDCLEMLVQLEVLVSKGRQVNKVQLEQPVSLDLLDHRVQ